MFLKLKNISSRLSKFYYLTNVAKFRRERMQLQALHLKFWTVIY